MGDLPLELGVSSSLLILHCDSLSDEARLASSRIIYQLIMTMLTGTPSLQFEHEALAFATLLMELSQSLYYSMLRIISMHYWFTHLA